MVIPIAMSSYNYFKHFLLLVCLGLAVTLFACKEEDEPQLPDPYDVALHRFAGGKEGTTFLQSSQAFGQPMDGLTETEALEHDYGDKLFETTYVQAGTLNQLYAGLGPLFNNSSCTDCHQDDGRPPFPVNLNKRTGFFLRVSAGNDPIRGPIPLPGFGGQLQQNAVTNTSYMPEVHFMVSYEDREETFADGTVVKLRKPNYGVIDAYTPFPAYGQLSPRIGSPVFGLGLLEAVPEAEVLSYADPFDRDRDQISGRANYVWSDECQKTMLGRFGWKANTATIKDQCAAAMVNDMGLTNPLHAQEEQYNMNVGWPKDRPAGALEVSQAELHAVTLYCQTLGVPAPRNLDRPEVKSGYRLFDETGCTKCHRPSMTTGDSPIAALAHQTIYPYTDLLLHDMGDDLADHRADFLADGKEWRTRPLWGIGLTLVVNGYESYLHDGRAQSIEEAILWHGGEAQEIKNKYKALSKHDRDQLVLFVESL